jgi:hypothetical protein
MLGREAKQALWSALRALTAKDYLTVRKRIEEAILLLELRRQDIDPGARFK